MDQQPVSNSNLEIAKLDSPELRIDEVLEQSGLLSSEQIVAISEHQVKHGTRFEESASALGMVTSEDLIWAFGNQRRFAFLSEGIPSDMSEDIVVAKHPFGEASEVIRDIRSQLLSTVLGPSMKPKRALAIISSNIGDGKTWFASNLAVSLSQLGASTLLIDADLRSPRLQDVFSIENHQEGLSTLLAGKSKLSFVCPIPELRRFFLLPAGECPINPLELIQGPVFSLLLQEMLKKFDYVLLDTPAVEHGSDARVIAARGGAAVVIARKDHGQVAALQRLVAQFGKGDVALGGVIFNTR